MLYTIGDAKRDLEDILANMRTAFIDAVRSEGLDEEILGSAKIDFEYPCGSTITVNMHFRDMSDDEDPVVIQMNGNDGNVTMDGEIIE